MTGVSRYTKVKGSLLGCWFSLRVDYIMTVRDSGRIDTISLCHTDNINVVDFRTLF